MACSPCCQCTDIMRTTIMSVMRVFTFTVLDDNLSAAENILRMLRPDKKYTDVEAKVLDLALVLHMEHGGGNNSTFTTRVVTSARI